MTLCFKRVFEDIGHDDFACHFGKYKRDVQSFCAKVYEFKQFNTIIAASELFFLLWFIFFAFISLKVMVLLFFYILTFTLFRYATDSEYQKIWNSLKRNFVSMVDNHFPNQRNAASQVVNFFISIGDLSLRLYPK